jgi:hypothetical protein
MVTTTTAHDLNEWIRLIAQQYDSMNDYYPGTIWVDTDTGTYGDARTLVLISTDGWTDDDNQAWESMTDSERNLYGIMVSEKYGTNPGKLPTPSEVAQ